MWVHNNEAKTFYFLSEQKSSLLMLKKLLRDCEFIADNATE